jgi:diadenylate cyclase
MGDRLRQLYESIDLRDLVEIGILSVGIYAVLRFLGQTRGAGLVRGLGLIVVGVFLVGQLIIASFDLTELAKLLDYLLTALTIGLVVIFQPELRRGLMVLGRYRTLQFMMPAPEPIADKLTTTALALSRDRLGALIAVQREVSLASYIETGEKLDAEVSPGLLRALFSHHSPLHDGAIILVHGRLVAAGCQLPLAAPPADAPRYGMRHRAALGLCDETDAVLLVVSEETGRISLGIGGKLEPVPRENLCRRLTAELTPPSEPVVRRWPRWRLWRKPATAA